jgi:hypothetical protein
VVVRLGIAEARVPIAGGLPMGFLGRWCHIVVEVVGAVHTLVEGIEGVVSGYVAEVGEVGWCCFGGAAAQTEASTSAPTGKGSRWCTRPSQVLLFLC